MDRRDLQIYKQEQMITKYEALLSRVVPRLNINSLAASPVDERPAKRSAEDDKRCLRECPFEYPRFFLLRLSNIMTLPPEKNFHDSISLIFQRAWPVQIFIFPDAMKERGMQKNSKLR